MAKEFDNVEVEITCPECNRQTTLLMSQLRYEKAIKLACKHTLTVVENTIDSALKRSEKAIDDFRVKLRSCSL